MDPRDEPVVATQVPQWRTHGTDGVTVEISEVASPRIPYRDEWRSTDLAGDWAILFGEFPELASGPKG